MTSRKFNSFIFVHIPKCGGTSFREYVHQAALENGIEPGRMYVPGTGALQNEKNIYQLTGQEMEEFRKSKMRILAGHLKYGIHETRQLNMGIPYYYTILREPVSRFISHYNFFERQLNGANHLNHLSREMLIRKLSEIANLQLNFCIHARRFRWNRLSALQKGLICGRRFLRTVSFNRLYNSVFIGLKADNAWLAEGRKNLEEEFGSFGILESMDLSVALLRARSPEWLRFSETDFPLTNQSKRMSADEPIEQKTIELIRKYNYYDLKFYDSALDIFERKIRGIALR